MYQSNHSNNKICKKNLLYTETTLRRLFVSPLDLRVSLVGGKEATNTNIIECILSRFYHQRIINLVLSHHYRIV